MRTLKKVDKEISEKRKERNSFRDKARILEENIATLLAEKKNINKEFVERYETTIHRLSRRATIQRIKNFDLRDTIIEYFTNNKYVSKNSTVSLSEVASQLGEKYRDLANFLQRGNFSLQHVIYGFPSNMYVDIQKAELYKKFMEDVRKVLE